MSGSPRVRAVPATLTVVPRAPLPRSEGLRRQQLIALVRSQEERWPDRDGKFTSKTNMKQMRAVLLNPRNGFRKAVKRVRPLTPSPSPPPPAPSPPAAPQDTEVQDVPDGHGERPRSRRERRALTTTEQQPTSRATGWRTNPREAWEAGA